MRRALVLVVLLFLLWAPGAYAWTWPTQGPVLLGFVFDSSHPYAGGQHRGIDIGASPGTAVVAPAAGTVTFAGAVPTGGKSVTIATADGYSVTLTHLGSIGVSKGASVGEGSGVGTVGPSGTPELDVPYLYMGVRETAEAQGYLDPLSFLPALPPPVAPAPAPTPPPPPAAASEPAPPPPAAATTTTSDEEPAATDAPPATTTTAEPEATTAAPDPPPDATADVTASSSDDAPAPDPASAADPPQATVPEPAPAEDAGGSDVSTSPPPEAAATEPTQPDDATTAPPEPPAAPADAPTPAPPPQQQAPPPPPPAPKKQRPHATVINPDPGFDPTAPGADEDAPPTDAAPAAPVATDVDPLPDIAAVDDAFAVRAEVPVTTVAIAAPVATMPRASAPRRPHAAPRRRIVVVLQSALPRPAARPRVHVPARRRRPHAPAAPARHLAPLAAARAPHRPRQTPWWPFALALAAACAAAVKGVRMISSSSQTSEGAHVVTEDPRRGRMAVRERTETPGPCRRPGRAVGHLRALPPPQRQRRPHGERNGRARHAGDGVGGPGRRIAS
jgi:hypothetical protein